MAIPSVGPSGQTNWLTQIAFSPGGRTLATTGYATMAWVFDAETGAPVSRPFQANGIGMCLAYAPDGRTLAVGTSQSWTNQPTQVQLWDLLDGRKPRLAVKVDAWPRLLAFCPDGKSRLLVNLESMSPTASLGSYQLWDVATLRPRGERLATSALHRGAIAFLPNNRLLTQGPGGIWEWDIPSGRPRRCGHPARPSVAFDRG